MLKLQNNEKSLHEVGFEPTAVCSAVERDGNFLKKSDNIF